MDQDAPRAPTPPQGPEALTLEPGRTYGWCTCGRSLKGALCDGSHKGTAMKSLRFSMPEPADQPATVWLCTCKKTQTPPYCDGSHAQPRSPRDKEPSHGG